MSAAQRRAAQPPAADQGRKVCIYESEVDIRLDEIAELGFGVGTLYCHFPTRDALIEAVLRNGCECFRSCAQMRLGDEGRVSLICPGGSDIHLLGDGRSIVHLDAEMPNSALDFSVAQKELHGTHAHRPRRGISDITTDEIFAMLIDFEAQEKHETRVRLQSTMRRIFGEHRSTESLK